MSLDSAYLPTLFIIRDILYRDRPELYSLNDCINTLRDWTETGKSRNKIIKDIKKKIRRRDNDMFMKIVIQSIDAVVERNEEIKNTTQNITNDKEYWDNFRENMPPEYWIPFWTYQVIYGIIACLQ